MEKIVKEKIESLVNKYNCKSDRIDLQDAENPEDKEILIHRKLLYKYVASELVEIMKDDQRETLS